MRDEIQSPQGEIYESPSHTLKSYSGDTLSTMDNGRCVVLYLCMTSFAINVQTSGEFYAFITQHTTYTAIINTVEPLFYDHSI